MLRLNLSDQYVFLDEMKSINSSNHKHSSKVSTTFEPPHDCGPHLLLEAATRDRSVHVQRLSEHGRIMLSSSDLKTRTLLFLEPHMTHQGRLLSISSKHNGKALERIFATVRRAGKEINKEMEGINYIGEKGSMRATCIANIDLEVTQTLVRPWEPKSEVAETGLPLSVRSEPTAHNLSTKQ
ncbi:uncharacterized protein BDR25DRAFT_357030 [Lindgomyces ingoldianus]|uniref:Uncharacterized protein n=1 Tax=Lindgomyces ingoldianus TaxID=673940 RepID=A0ACB6QQV8_9PLEO|nr:uncharacterized protein BDR25DRAFT_357030 [Lindgomyces ingoldianus]KAF2468672.1 hypothetical protein BDR25DRAFT_357030 [Lindgomyces ingoldianus]